MLILGNTFGEWLTVAVLTKRDLLEQTCVCIHTHTFTPRAKILRLRIECYTKQDKLTIAIRSLNDKGD